MSKNNQRAPKNVPQQDKVEEKKEVVSQEETTKTETPVVDKPAVDNGQSSDQSGNQGGEESEPTAPEVVVPPEELEPALPDTPKYTTEYLMAYWGYNGGRTEDVVTRLATYLHVVMEVHELEAMKYHVGYMDEILNLLNTLNAAEFSATILAMANFISVDLENYGDKSAFYSFRTQRPYAGSCTRSSQFLEMMRQAGPRASRAATVEMLSRAPVLSQVFPGNYAAQFINALRG